LSTSPGERGRRLLLAAGHASRRGQPGLVLRLLEVAASSELSTFDRVRAELLREDFEGVVLADSQRVVHLCGLGRRAVEAGESDLALDLAYAAARLSCASAVDAQVRTEVSSLAGRLARDSTDARAVAALALADPVGHGRAVLSMLTDLDQDRAVTGDALAAYAAAARAVGDYVLASTLIDRAETDFRARGLLGPLARTLCIAADLRLDLGDWDRSAAAREEFSHLGGASMSASHQAFARATTAKGAALRGDIDTALELVSDAEHSPAARSGTSQRARMQIARGLAHISSGRHGEAFSALRRVFEPDDACHHFREQFDAIAYLAESAVRTGNQDQARVMLQRLQPVAHASRSPVLSTQMDYAAAVLASDDAAEPLFLAALSADSAAAPWPRARLQLAYGCWLRRQHRVTQSRGPLQSSLSIFQQLGATRWAEEAGAELNASGVQLEAGRDAPVPPLLSAQEWKIARLAAQGLSNRQIGEQLYLSPRTVGSHLYRIFPKLGVTARGQIALRLDEEHAVRPDR
jgi:ATP/maltotriose-dependent transcriptional regulator MalT